MQIGGSQQISSTGLTGMAPSTQPTTDKGKRGELGEKDFMALLIAELKNQDPLQPMSDREFISQMAQLQSAQVMQAMNTNLKTGLAELLALQNMNLASSLIGKTVEAAPADGKVTGVVSSVGIVKGQVQLTIGNKTVDLQDLSRVIESPVLSPQSFVKG